MEKKTPLTFQIIVLGVVCLSAFLVDYRSRMRYQEIENRFEKQEVVQHKRSRKSTIDDENKETSAEVGRPPRTRPQVVPCSCPPGPTGPPGPQGLNGLNGLDGTPGEKGERGIGLFEPDVRDKLINIEANITEVKTFKCTFFGNPIPEVTWKHSFAKTKMKTETAKHERTITSYLHVSAIMWEDRGAVQCMAKNMLGEISIKGELKVHSIPEILPVHQHQFNLHKGQDFIFPECKVKSYPAANILWEKEKESIVTPRMFASNGYLKISKIRKRDEGVYVCKAKNYLGSDDLSIQIKVQPLSFSYTPPKEVVPTTTPYILTCSAKGNPEEMEAKWISTSGNTTLKYSIKKGKNSINVTAMIYDAGKYYCRVKDNDNETITSSNIDVKFFHLNTKFGHSRDFKRLGKWLIGTKGIGNYTLCWKAEVHGWLNAEFHRRCDGKTPTITLFKPFHWNDIIGGYTDVAWKFIDTSSKKRSCKYSKETFLFEFLTGREKYVVQKNHYDQAICYNDGINGPSFGDGNLHYYDDYSYDLHWRYIRQKSDRIFDQSLHFDDARLGDIEVHYKV